MENVNFNLAIHPSLPFGEIPAPSFLFPKHQEFEDSFINYLLEDKKADLSDPEYKADKDYINSVPQF